MFLTRNYAGARAAPLTPAGKESARYFFASSHAFRYNNMSVQRTPPRATLASASESGSGSAPNLSTLSDGEDLYTNINTRKRKQRTEESDYKKDFMDFRMEMMNFLNNFSKTQTENLNQIKEQIADIKNEIKTVKISTENFSKQLERANTDIENIKTKTTATEVKIKHIETEITQIKTQQSAKCSTLKSLVECHEDLILELKDRCDREKNIVIVGISEINDKNFKSRQHHDNQEVLKVITMISEDCPKPIKCMRLGKYVQNQNRPLKVHFENSKTAKYLLKNRTKLPENIKLFFDQTPKQKQYLETLKEELHKRTQDGEKNLSIKYVKGTPKIVVVNQKNQ